MAYRTNVGPAAPEPLGGKMSRAKRLLTVAVPLSFGLAMLTPIFLLPAVAGAIVVGIKHRRSRWWERAAPFMREGRLDEAAAVLVVAARETANMPQVHALVRLAYGDVEVRLGNVELGRATLLELERDRALPAGWYTHWLRALLTVSAVAAGEVDEAQRRLAAAEKGPRTESWDAHPWARGVVAARVGRYHDAAAFLGGEPWGRTVRDCAFDSRARQSLRAFAIHRIEPERPIERGAADVLRWLAGEWPELAAYLA